MLLIFFTMSFSLMPKLFGTSLEHHAKFSTFDGVPLADPTEYHEMVGCLVIVTRSDIAYAIHIVSQYVSAHRSMHTEHKGHLLSFTSSLTV